MIALLAALLAVVSAPYAPVSYGCNGVTATFSVNFPYQTVTDLAVTTTTAAGAVTTLTYGGDWTVNVTSTTSTATLTLTNPTLRCPSGNTLKIARSVPYTQTTSFKGQTNFSPPLHEFVYDRLEMQIQQLYNLSPVNSATQEFVESYVDATLSGGSSIQPLLWTLAGDGVTTTFSLPSAAVVNANLYQVTIDGLVQAPTADYTVSLTPQQIVFVSAPALGASIKVRSLGYARALNVSDNSFVLATGSSTSRDLAHRFADFKSVKDYGVVGDGITNDTTQINAAFTAVASGATLYFPKGTYRTCSQITQAPGTTVVFDGGAYLQPDASCWSGSYVWQIYDNWNSPAGDFINGQYLRGNRTALYDFKSFPTAPIAATTLLGFDGIGIVVANLRSWGAKNGCIEIQKGAEWRLNGSQCIAPPERSATAKGLSDAATDGLIDGFVSEAYPYGVYLTSTSSNNDIFNSHVWGQPAVNDNPAWTISTAYTTNMYVKNGGNTYRCTTAGISAGAGGPSGVGATITDGTVVWTFVAAGTGQNTRALNWGFWFDGGGSNAGGSNRCWGCIADTPERVVPANPASAANGGVGFYINNWQNSITGAYVIGTTNLSKAFIIDGGQGNSIVASNAPFDATKFEAAGYVVFAGGSSAANNEIIGGSFNRDGQVKTRPFWHDPTNGNMFWGSAAVTPGFDNNVGIAHYNNGNLGATRDGEIFSSNRPSTDGVQWCLRKNTTTIGCFGGATATELSITAPLTWTTARTQATLGTPAGGTITYCSDCTIANPCAGGGTGAIAKRLNGVWVCN